MGFASELANYGEYSGAPSEQQTYEYAKTILSLIVKEKNPDGKILIIGGGIANFTNVAATFKVRSFSPYTSRTVCVDWRALSKLYESIAIIWSNTRSRYLFAALALIIKRAYV